jgi:hypothetical protein
MRYETLSEADKKIYDRAVKDIIKKIDQVQPKLTTVVQSTQKVKKHDSISITPGITLGQFIKERRILENLTQHYVASELGYDSSQMISNVERDLAPFPLDKIAHLCKLLKASKEEMKQVLLRRYANKIDEAFK